LPYLFQGEAEMLALLDKADSLQIAFVVMAVTASRSGRRGQQLLTLVKTQRLNVHSGAARQLSGSHD
jgi:hypothetical protein